MDLPTSGLLTLQWSNPQCSPSFSVCPPRCLYLFVLKASVSQLDLCSDETQSRGIDPYHFLYEDIPPHIYCSGGTPSCSLSEFPSYQRTDTGFDPGPQWCWGPGTGSWSPAARYTGPSRCGWSRSGPASQSQWTRRERWGSAPVGQELITPSAWRIYWHEQRFWNSTPTTCYICKQDRRKIYWTKWTSVRMQLVCHCRSWSCDKKRGTGLSFSHNAMCWPIKHVLAHIPHRSLLL